MNVRMTATLVFAAAIGLCSVTSASENPLFKGKTISLLVGSSVGGGTDNAARAIAAALSKQMGNVPIVVKNMPGANGLIAMNYFAERAMADPFTIIFAGNSAADPATYRTPASRYDPTKFQIIGGMGRGGTVLILNAEAAKRLQDKEAAPVTIGAVGALPRSGMLSAAWGMEFLGWNARWVMGYPSTNELLIAMERGEVDMTSTGNLMQIRKLQASGNFKTLTQSGVLKDGKFVGRDDFKNIPLIADEIEGKIKDPTAIKAFQYWSGLTAIDKWIALGADVPVQYLDAYRKAFQAALSDADFDKRATERGDDLEPVSAKDFARLLNLLGDTPPDAIEYIGTMVQRQSNQ